jgi:alcohol dehydrogenase
MRALVSDRRSVRLIEDYPDPQPAPGEVRVRTILAGICNTDLEVTRGYAGFEGVLGHEFVGVVDRLSDLGRPEDRALLGRRVVGEINVG